MAVTRSHPSKQRVGTPATPKKAPSDAILTCVRDRPGAAISKQLQTSHRVKRSVRRPSAQLREELESVISSITPAQGYEEAPRFLFVPFPDVKDIAEETHLAIDASSTSERFLARYPMYNAKNMSKIQQELGKGFASHGMTSIKPYSEIPILHQGIVTMQHLCHSFKRDVTFRSWNWLQTQLNTLTARPKSASAVKLHQQSRRKPASHPRKAQQHHLFSDPNTSCIIFLHWTIDPGPPLATIASTYATIATLQTTRPTLIRAFPSFSELTCESFKIHDIHTLNSIAATSPFKHSYRPLTCFTHGEPHHDPTHCPLRGQRQIVMKRTLSCGGDHVEIIPGNKALPRHCPSPSPSSPHHWFGQSHEPFFSLFGEFRVFVVAAPSASATATRGRRGRVLHTVITEWVSPQDHPGAMYARAASAQDFTSAALLPLTCADLHEFALYVYDALRARGDWEAHFESLEVGVRLDIGVGWRGGMEEGGEEGKREVRKKKEGEEEGKRRARSVEKKRFFVNEITRFYCADYFSQHTLGAPQQEVCWAFAEAVDGYFGAGKGGEVKRER